MQSRFMAIKCCICALLLTLFLLPNVVYAKRIGIVMFSDEVRYVDAVKGIRDKLKQEGFDETNSMIIEENADRNRVKAMEIVRNFKNLNLDLIFTAGTSITIPLSREIKDVPVVFCIIYDPVEAGIVRSWESSSNNTTGTSTKLPMESLLECLISFKPVQRLAVFYSPGEKNSESLLRDLQLVQDKYKLMVVPVPVLQKDEVMEMLPYVARTVDAFYITGSNMVDGQVALIVKASVKYKIVTITHLEDLCHKGVLLGVYVSSYRYGLLSGEKGVQILRGANPSSIPIETLKDYTTAINMRTVKEGQFHVPPDFAKKSTAFNE